MSRRTAPTQAAIPKPVAPTPPSDSEAASSELGRPHFPPSAGLRYLAPFLENHFRLQSRSWNGRIAIARANTTLTADYTVLVLGVQSTTGRVRPRQASAWTVTQTLPPRLRQSDWANLRV